MTRTFGPTGRLVRAQATFLRALTRGEWRARHYGPPLNLQRPWELFQEDPDTVGAAAAEIRRRASGVGDAGTTKETDGLARFVDDAHDLIGEVAQILPQLPALRVGDAEVRDYLAAWEDLRQRPFRGLQG
jgi:hypothetical protein